MKSTLPLLLATLLPLTAMGDIVFSENFEGCDIGENIGTTQNAQWRSSGYTKGESPGRGLATKGSGDNASVIAITTPESGGGGSDSATYNLTSHFPETSGTLRLTLDVFPERGGGQILVRPRSTNPSDTLALVQFRGGRDMSIRAYARGGQGDKESTPLGPFRFNRWYHVTITLHLEKTTPTYDVEVVEAGNPANTVGISGLECIVPANAAGNLLIGSIFDKKARYGWDNIVIEKLSAGK